MVSISSPPLLFCLRRIDNHVYHPFGWFDVHLAVLLETHLADAERNGFWTFPSADAQVLAVISQKVQEIGISPVEIIDQIGVAAHSCRHVGIHQVGLGDEDEQSVIGISQHPVLFQIAQSMFQIKVLVDTLILFHLLTIFDDEEMIFGISFD